MSQKCIVFGKKYLGKIHNKHQVKMLFYLDTFWDLKANESSYSEALGPVHHASSQQYHNNLCASVHNRPSALLVSCTFQSISYCGPISWFIYSIIHIQETVILFHWEQPGFCLVFIKLKCTEPGFSENSDVLWSTVLVEYNWSLNHLGHCSFCYTNLYYCVFNNSGVSWSEKKKVAGSYFKCVWPTFSFYVSIHDLCGVGILRPSTYS